MKEVSEHDGELDNSEPRIDFCGFLQLLRWMLDRREDAYMGTCSVTLHSESTGTARIQHIDTQPPARVCAHIQTQALIWHVAGRLDPESLPLATYECAQS
eukprot:403070-Amphidinium_carterae.1